MRRLRTLWMRAAGSLCKARREREMAEEMASHLEMQIAENLRAGMTPEEARRDALLRSGGLDQAKEACRDRRSLPLVENFARDAGYALRQLRRSPGFAAVVVATLALGIGANTAAFSVTYALLLRPLPYPHAERLFRIGEFDRKADKDLQTVSYPNFTDWQTQNSVFERMAVWHMVDLSIVGPAQPEQVVAAAASPEIFETLGVAPEFGGTLNSNDNAPFVVLSHDLFVRQFGRDRNLIGKGLRIGQFSVRVGGVAPPGFHFPPGAELWIPERFFNPASIVNRDAHNFHAIARLKPGVRPERAQAEMETIARRLEQAYPRSNRNQGARIVGLQEAATGSMRPTLWTLFGAAGLLLLIACANVANMLLSRSASRKLEIAVRTSLGARRGRIVGQLLSESALLAILGGAAGLALAYGGVKALPLWIPGSVEGLDAVRVDAAALAFAVAASLATTILFGLAPAWRLSRTHPQEALGGAERGANEARGQTRIRGVFVVAQFALAATLLIGTGLLLKTLSNLRRVDLGFRADNVLTVELRGPYFRNGGVAAWSDFLAQAMREIGKLPGVESVGAVTELPVEGVTWATRFSRPGEVYASEPAQPGAAFRIVSPGYFATMRIPVLRGRALDWRDTRETEQVVVISQTLARRYFAGEDPVGKQIASRMSEGALQRIVGVVGDVRQSVAEIESIPAIYESVLQRPFPSTLVVRTKGEPMSVAGAVREAIRRIDREQPLGRMASMEEIVARALGWPRFRTLLLGLFAALGAALAGVGVYGVLSYSVARRTRELGVRTALGASRVATLRLIVRQGMGLALVGVGAGAAAACAATRALSSMLYGTTATDPGVFLAASLLLAAAALPACMIPAIRAANMDPLRALRHE